MLSMIAHRFDKHLKIYKFIKKNFKLAFKIVIIKKSKEFHSFKKKIYSKIVFYTRNIFLNSHYPTNKDIVRKNIFS